MADEELYALKDFVSIRLRLKRKQALWAPWKAHEKFIIFMLRGHEAMHLPRKFIALSKNILVFL